MRTVKDYLMLALKGSAMGAADVIPGVSGGTIAFMTGIFEELVGSINSFDSTAIRMLFSGKLKEFWKHINGSFLMTVGCGILLSVITLAKVMLYLLNNHPIETWAFFFGLIVASSLFILRGISGWRFREGFLLVFGMILGAVICTLSPTQTPDSLWFIFLSGALAICAMILPGISGSFILLILGKYEYILGAISGLASGENLGHNLLIIGVFGIGAIIGILAFSRFLHWLLARRQKETMVVLAGFIIGSLVKIWPWANAEAIVLSQFPELAGMSEALPAEVVSQYMASADLHIGGAVLFALIGFFLVTGIEMAGRFVSRKKTA